MKGQLNGRFNSVDAANWCELSVVSLIVSVQRHSFANFQNLEVLTSSHKALAANTLFLN